MAPFTTPIALSLSPKHFAHDLRASFRGLTVSENPEGYNIILRAFLSDGTAVYSMTVAQDIAQGLSDLLDALSGSGGAKLWHYDKFANGRR